MARASYTLRELGQDFTTYVRYSGTTFSASLASFEGSEFYLEALVTNYDEVTVSWNSPIFEIGETPLPVETFIRWSLSGEPQTIDDGFALTNSTVSDAFVHEPVAGTSWQGKWVYYTLFLKYASTDTSVYTDGEQYYEKLASVGVLVTKNYESIDDLWSRIPEYYRTQDAVDNHLYDYLSIFAWDLDTLRTLIDYLMIQKDPQVANSYALQQMMEELGTVITTIELGASRARNYIDDVFNLRLNKGTIQGIIASIQAIAGSRVDIDTVLKKINVYPQRINWIRDPKLTQSLSNGWYSAATPLVLNPPEVYDVSFYGSGLEFGASSNAASVTLVPQQSVSNFLTLNTPPITFYGSTVTFNNASVSFASPQGVYNLGPTDNTMYLIGNYTIPFTKGETFYFRTEEPDDSLIDVVALYKTDGTLAASAGVASPGTVLSRLNGEVFYKLDTSISTSSGNCYLLLYTTVPGNGYINFRNMSLEKEYIGSYFDGNTNLGGWLKGSTLKSDYRWTGTPVMPNTSYSVYSSDAWRTQQTLKAVYEQFIPVNWTGQYQIVFDELPYQTPTPVAPSTLPPNIGPLTYIT